MPETATCRHRISSPIDILCQVVPATFSASTAVRAGSPDYYVIIIIHYLYKKYYSKHIQSSTDHEYFLNNNNISQIVRGEIIILGVNFQYRLNLTNYKDLKKYMAL